MSDLMWPWRAYRFATERMERAAKGEERRSNAPIDPAKPVLFLSYRTAEHTDVARALHLALEQSGFRVWFDEDRGTMPSRILYLDVFLEEAMRAADVLVLVLPAAAAERRLEDRDTDMQDQLFASLVRFWAILAVVASYTARSDGSPPSWHQELEALDEDQRRERLLAQSVFAFKTVRRSVPPPLRAMWSLAVYGVNPLKLPEESWQAWERRIAGFHGLATVSVAVRSPPPGEQPDVVLDPKAVDREARELLAPRLVGLRRRPGRPPLTPQLQRLVARRRRYALIALAIAVSLVLLFIVFVVFVVWLWIA
jgi:hypothetical protein